MSTPTVVAVEGAALSMHADPNDERSSVRFDSHPRSRRPRLVTKTYSVPLWKRRGSTSGSSDPDSSRQPACPEVDKHVVLKLSLPRLQTRMQSPTRCTDSMPLTPCLVHRSRRTRSKSPTSPMRTDLITVPLRPCCAACQEVTDAARSQGDTWTERFSPAAYYRRCHSTDSQPRTITVAGSAASAFYGSLARDIPISVDEVDKRRRSIDGASIASSNVPGDTSASVEKPLPVAPDSPSSAHGRPRLSPIRISEEVDDNDEEDQLFPLPSRAFAMLFCYSKPLCFLILFTSRTSWPGPNLTNSSSPSNSTESSTHEPENPSDPRSTESTCPMKAALPSTPKKVPSTSTVSPPVSPVLRFLRSFSGSSPRQVIADVIRGVSAFGTGGGGLNVQM
ncbi:hypothetical protein BKA82DRAFT_4085884 [Pisolithus tinctorius]|nr:hypothetical protein BKA82DRAFT_4085884 [Pisolithus tinctorius]